MHANGCLDNVLQRGHVRIKIELLETMPILRRCATMARSEQLVQTSVPKLVADLFVIDLDRAAIDRLEMIDTAEKCGFP